MWLTRHLDPRDLDGEVSRILVPLREDQRLRLFPGSLHLLFPRPALTSAASWARDLARPMSQPELRVAVSSAYMKTEVPGT